MKVTYIFDRDRMQDPVDKSWWTRGETRDVKPENAAMLLRSSDCWRDPDAPPPPPPKPAPVAATPAPPSPLAGPGMQSIYFTADEAVKTIGEAQFAYFTSWGNWLRKADPEERLRVIVAMVPSFADQGPVSDEELEEMLTPAPPPALEADTGTFDMSAAPILQGETTQPEGETNTTQPETPEAQPETPAEPVEEDDDDLDEQIGNMPQLDSMTKAQLIQYTHREFGKDLDKTLKVDEMRAKVKQLVNGGRPQ